VLFLLTKPRYIQAAVFAPFVLAEAAAWFLLAPNYNSHVSGRLLPMQVFAVAQLAQPFHCFWRTPPDNPLRERNAIRGFVALTGALFALAVALELPFRLWPCSLLLLLPPFVAAVRGELAFRSEAVQMGDPLTALLSLSVWPSRASTYKQCRLAQASFAIACSASAFANQLRKSRARSVRGRDSLSGASGTDHSRVDGGRRGWSDRGQRIRLAEHCPCRPTGRAVVFLLRRAADEPDHRCVDHHRSA
jgi:hypothetical protein